MKVCVCGGTNPATDPKWLGFAGRLGDLLTKNDFEMVWGGNAYGVLSHIHKEYVNKQKANTLVLPTAYQDDLKKVQADKVLATNLVIERTHQMFLMTNVIIVVPGGIGTIYEFWSAIEGRRAGEYDVDIILLNYKNFWNHQLQHFKFINKYGFTKIGMGGAPYTIEPKNLFTVVETPEQVITELKKIQKKREG